MGQQIVQSMAKAVWALARKQHGVVARWQLVELGVNRDAIHHRLEIGRLHRTPWTGVYAVGRPQLTQEGLWMAAVLACGREAVLSHAAAAALLGVLKCTSPIEVSVPLSCRPRRPGIKVHRRSNLRPSMLTKYRGIPVTNIVCTLVDVAPQLRDSELEVSINEADKLDLIDPDTIRTSLDEYAAQPGVAIVRRVLDIPTFSLTDSALERLFKPIPRRAGLSRPLTQVELHGYRVDFYWPDLGLIVETDGLRYHRTPHLQSRDRVRDQVLTAAGLTVLRFTHRQIRYDAEHVEETLRTVAARLRRRRLATG
jgi:very-short-patch-repair endonuclease